MCRADLDGAARAGRRWAQSWDVRINDRMLLGLKNQIAEVLCRYRHRTSYADLVVMPMSGWDCALDSISSANRSA
jgi:hypothetical protein